MTNNSNSVEPFNNPETAQVRQDFQPACRALVLGHIPSSQFPAGSDGKHIQALL